MAEIYPSLPQVSIPKNPSPFAVFAAIRNTCLENKRKQDTILQLQSAGIVLNIYLAKYGLWILSSYFINLTLIHIFVFLKNFLAAWKEVEDVSENGGESSSDESLRKQINLPKVVAIGLQGKKNVGFETLEKHKSTIFSLLFVMM